MKDLKLYVVDANRPTTQNNSIVYAVSSTCEKSLDFYKNNQPAAYPVSYLDKDSSKAMLFFSTQRFAVATLEWVEEDKRFYIRETAETRAMCSVFEKKASQKLKTLASSFLSAFDDSDDSSSKNDDASAKPADAKPKTTRTRKLAQES